MLEHILRLLSLIAWAIVGAILWAIVPMLQAIFHLAQQIHHLFQ